MAARIRMAMAATTVGALAAATTAVDSAEVITAGDPEVSTAADSAAEEDRAVGAAATGSHCAGRHFGQRESRLKNKPL